MKHQKPFELEDVEFYLVEIERIGIVLPTAARTGVFDKLIEEGWTVTWSGPKPIDATELSDNQYFFICERPVSRIAQQFRQSSKVVNFLHGRVLP